jgi:hypothetical protein
MDIGRMPCPEVAMTRRILVMLFLFAVLAFAVSTAAAGAIASSPQVVRIEVLPEGLHQEVRLRDGSQLYGRVTSVADDHIVFRTLAGIDVTIPRADIASLAPVKGEVVDREFRPTDANTTRLLFGPTGRSLHRAEGYVGVYEFMLPFVQVGVTDRISIGAGTPLFFGAGSSHPVWVTPKIQFFSSGKLSMAAGAMHFFNVDDDTVGVAYMVMTHGTADSAFTAGGGYAYARGDEESAGAAVVMLGGERRISRRLKFITENYWWEGSAGIASGGIRFIGDRLSADLALAAPLGADETLVFPVVNFVWAF